MKMQAIILHSFPPGQFTIKDGVPVCHARCRLGEGSFAELYNQVKYQRQTPAQMDSQDWPPYFTLATTVLSRGGAYSRFLGPIEHRT